MTRRAEGKADSGVGATPPSVGRALAVYNLSRLLLFVASAFAVFLVTRFNGFPLLLIALLVSTPLSWFVLGRQREAMGLALEARRAQQAADKAELRRPLDETDGPRT